MLVYPLEISQNRPLQNKGANVQDKSRDTVRLILRVAASFNNMICEHSHVQTCFVILWRIYLAEMVSNPEQPSSVAKATG
jgi:hypothetical protein